LLDASKVVKAENGGEEGMIVAGHLPPVVRKTERQQLAEAGLRRKLAGCG